MASKGGVVTDGPFGEGKEIVGVVPLSAAPSVKDRVKRAMLADKAEELLERFIKEYLRSQTKAEVLFTWHGGEALMRPIKFYQKALDLKPEDPDVLTDQGVMFQELGQFDKAIATLQGGFALAPWQFLVASQLHAQIGVLRYVRKEFDEALPHLQKSFSRHWLARAMLGALLWRRKDLAGMERTFLEAEKNNKKEGLVWCTHAWLLDKEGRHDDAVKVLGKAAAQNPSDEKLKSALQALQNDKKLKLGKLYGEQWFQFHLEKMPPQMISPMGGRGGRRVVYQRR